jgi:hypothetical protein
MIKEKVGSHEAEKNNKKIGDFFGKDKNNE